MKKLALAAALALSTGAIAAPAGAADLQPAASSYAFEYQAGCLGLHTGAGIDGYDVDGAFYDLPTTSEVASFLVDVPGGLQAEIIAVPLEGYEVTDDPQLLQVNPGAGCPGTEEPPACETAAPAKADPRVAKLETRVSKLEAKVARLQARLAKRAR